MNVARRTKKLKALLDIRIGPGAAILSGDVKKIHLDFARKINDGHFGARKVWRNYLPRLKYHNPAISMTISRTDDQEGPATLTVHFAPPSNTTSPTASPAPAPASSTNPSTPPSGHNASRRVETIDMKHKQDSEILSKLLELTNATPYEPSPDELAEMREVDDDKMRSDRDKKAQMRLNQIRRQEQALLDQARGAGKLESASL